MVTKEKRRKFLSYIKVVPGGSSDLVWQIHDVIGDPVPQHVASTLKISSSELTPRSGEVKRRKARS